MADLLGGDGWLTDLLRRGGDGGDELVELLGGGGDHPLLDHRVDARCHASLHMYNTIQSCFSAHVQYNTVMLLCTRTIQYSHASLHTYNTIQ